MLHAIYTNTQKYPTLNARQTQALIYINNFIVNAIRTRPDVKPVVLTADDIARDGRPAALGTIKKNLDHIELVYCPSKAFEDYYRNTDPRYVPINCESIYKAGRILHL